MLMPHGNDKLRCRDCPRSAILFFVAKLPFVWYNTAMNGYDFDKTILRGNSVQRLFYYCMVRFPYLILYMVADIFIALLYAVRILNKHRFLTALEGFLLFVPNRQKVIERFWDKNLKHIRSWYLCLRRDDDVVISASPQFEVKVAAERLGIKCIATEGSVEPLKFGKVHCYGAEKVVAYKRAFGDTPLLSYYSDSWSDEPMFAFAQKGYLVKGDNVFLVYENGKKLKKSAWKQVIKNGNFTDEAEQ